ncbi:MAG: helix-hairpin-helix domain-containing protein [Kofleriaceae bacterium]
MSSQLDGSLTNSDSLAPWKRGEVPAHWPDFAADRVDEQPRSALDNALLRERVREAPPILVSELMTEPRLALDAYPHERLDELADEDELDDLSDDALVLEDCDVVAELGEPAEVRRGYVPPLLDRTRSVFKRTASNLLVPIGAIVLLVLAMGGTWSTASATPAPPWSATTPPRTTMPARTAIEPDDPPGHTKSGRKELAGKLNLNTASEDQLMLLPSVGPSKAERIVTWRKKNGGFKRTADLRRVKGFGYKTFKKLEPFLDIKGDTTLAAK